MIVYEEIMAKNSVQYFYCIHSLSYFLLNDFIFTWILQEQYRTLQRHISSIFTNLSADNAMIKYYNKKREKNKELQPHFSTNTQQVKVKNM